MIVEFEEKDHIYSVNGDIASISVTELLKKHGLSPNYDGVNKQALRESAEKKEKTTTKTKSKATPKQTELTPLDDVDDDDLPF